MQTRRYLWTLFAALTTGCLAVAGCGKQAGNEKSGGAEGQDAAGDEIEKALAELSPEDQVLAKKQKTCPVGGGDLGSMGTPKIVTVKGRKVFICCEGCRKEVEDNPDKILAQLK